MEEKTQEQNGRGGAGKPGRESRKEFRVAGLWPIVVEPLSSAIVPNILHKRLCGTTYHSRDT